MEGGKARFVGVYQIIEKRDGREVPLPAGCPYNEWTQNHYYYVMKREPGYEDLENRIVIDWGPAALS